MLYFLYLLTPLSLTFHAIVGHQTSWRSPILCKFLSSMSNFHLQLSLFCFFNLNVTSFSHNCKQDAFWYYHHNVNLVIVFFVVGVFHGHFCFCSHFYKNDISFTFFFVKRMHLSNYALCVCNEMVYNTHFVKSLWLKVWFDIFGTLFTTFVKFLSPMDLITHYNAHCEDWWGDQKVYHHWNDKWI